MNWEKDKQKFKMIRRFLGYTQKELADVLGCSKILISYYERGFINKASGRKISIPKGKLEKMANLYKNKFGEAFNYDI